MVSVLQVDNYTKMLAVCDVIIGEAPSFKNHTLVAFPITAVFLGPMATEAGFRMFSDPRVNAMIKNMLDTWFQYLSSPQSRYVLHSGPTGWFGPAASEVFPDFAQTFICDPKAPYYGFVSWENFFTRRFRPGLRPVQHPHDDSVVNSACESRVFRIEYNISEDAKFWLKGHAYSILRILHHDALAPQFLGGTVYQAFLSSLSYHRWHSPVNGRIVKTVNIPGSYYLQVVDTTSNVRPGPDGRQLLASQDFMAQVAARCLIFIEADNPAIGLMCFVGVGMLEVSSCQALVTAGQRVRKGDDIGTFHYGGSTHCLVFRKETNITFSDAYPPGETVLLNEAIARVTR